MKQTSRKERSYLSYAKKNPLCIVAQRKMSGVAPGIKSRRQRNSQLFEIVRAKSGVESRGRSRRWYWITSNFIDTQAKSPQPPGRMAWSVRPAFVVWLDDI
jgi:hypothetical protein